MAKKISEFTLVTTRTGAHHVPILQTPGGSDDPKRITVDNLILILSPQAYTATLGSDVGGGTSAGLYWSRIGKYLRIFGKLTLGTTASGSDNWFSIPSGINIDTGFVGSLITKLGEVTRLTSGSNDVDGAIQHHMCYDSSLGAGKIRLTLGVQSGTYRQSAGNNFNSSEVINIDSGLIPIAEW